MKRISCNCSAFTMCSLALSGLLRSIFVVVLVAVSVSGEATSSPLDGLRGSRLRKVVPEAPAADSNGTSESTWQWFSRSGFSLLRECTDFSKNNGSSGSVRDVGVCLKLAAVRAIDKLSRTKRELPLTGGFVLVPDNSVDEEIPGSAGSLPTLDNLPRSLEEKRDTVDKMLISRVIHLLQSHSLRFEFPTAKSMADMITQEDSALNSSDPSDKSASSSARRRPSSGLGSILNLGLIMGSSVLPVKLSLLAVLVGKALLLSVLAFFIPASRFLQALVTGRGMDCL